jgi:hypothetical protein
MKSLHTYYRLIVILAIILGLNNMLFSQTVISSVKVKETTSALLNQIELKSDVSEHENLNSTNLFKSKSYLDAKHSETYHAMFLLNEQINEPQKTIEDWMLKSSRFEVENYKKIETEQIRQVEHWMIDENFWKIQSEDENEIEDWMTDTNFWIMVN